jgi:SHS2 domain-containing protein
MEQSFKEFDHSGDVGIEAWGATRKEVLANAALGLFSLVATGGVEPVIERKITVVSKDEENLLVDWLSEIITTVATFGEVYVSVDVNEPEPGCVEGRLHGEPIDESKHRLRFEVKAATYHNLVFRKTTDGYYVRVIFDL